MKIVSALILTALFMPLGTAYAQASSLSARAHLIRTFLTQAGCPPYDFACTRVAEAIARPALASSTIITTPATNAVDTFEFTILSNSANYTILPSCGSAGCTRNMRFGPTAIPSVQVANMTLISNLPTLFTLNALFEDSSGGLLTPGKASLGNIIVLYQLFFAHNGLAY